MPEPLTLPEDHAEIVLAVSESVTARCLGVEGIGRVHTFLPQVSGKQQYLEAVGVEVGDGDDADVEVRACFVRFVGFEDDAGRGCEEDPVFRLIYDLHLVNEFVDERKDGSCSAKDFARLVMILRRDFLRDRRFGFGTRVYGEPLRTARRIAQGEDPVTGIYGHFAGFELRVEITPYG